MISRGFTPDFAYLLRRSAGCYSSRSSGLPVSLVPWVTPILPINVGLHPVHLHHNRSSSKSVTFA